MLLLSLDSAVYKVCPPSPSKGEILFFLIWYITFFKPERSFHIGSSLSERPNRACWARRNLCSTWLLIGHASVPDQSEARPNRACLTSLLIKNLPLNLSPPSGSISGLIKVPPEVNRVTSVKRIRKKLFPATIILRACSAQSISLFVQDSPVQMADPPTLQLKTIQP